jgi:hypothetical protein
MPSPQDIEALRALIRKHIQEAGGADMEASIDRTLTPTEILPLGFNNQSAVDLWDAAKSSASVPTGNPVPPNMTSDSGDVGQLFERVLKNSSTYDPSDFDDSASLPPSQASSSGRAGPGLNRPRLARRFMDASSVQRDLASKPSVASPFMAFLAASAPRDANAGEQVITDDMDQAKQDLANYIQSQPANQPADNYADHGIEGANLARRLYSESQARNKKKAQAKIAATLMRLRNMQLFDNKE